MKALVVNASVDRTPAGRSREFYNLGAAKVARFLERTGYEVTRAVGDPGMLVAGYDLVCVSAIFSWHAERAAEIVYNAQQTGAEVRAGGPGLHGLRAWFEWNTGVKPEWRPSPEFDHEPGEYRMIYAVRGCPGETIDGERPMPCRWCNVPKVEGTRFIINRDFQPAPMLLDNNLSGMPDWMQDHIVARYREAGMQVLDANSGFEPGKFTAETRARWEPVLRGPWRWGFDRIEEERHARSMALLLDDVSARRRRVYAMCGNEPLATCYERARKVTEWGCEPHVQFEVPLAARDRYDAATWPINEQPRFEWTIALGRDFSRYWNSLVWKSAPIWEYRPRLYEPPPFASLRPTVAT